MRNSVAGVLAIVVIAIGTYLGFTKDIPFTRGYEVKAIVASAPELHGNSPVRIAGVNVGKVKRVERGPGSTVVVTMEIRDDARPIHRDATLKVRPRIFLEGNFFVDLTPGTARAPELEDGDTIPLAQTAVPVQLDEILGVLTSDTRTNLRGLVRELGAALDKGGAQALHDGYAQWEGAFENTAVAMEALRGEQEDDLSGFIAEMADVSDALASRRGSLADLVVDFDRVAGALAGRDAELAATVRGLSETARAAYPALGAVNAALPELRRFTGEVRPVLRRAPRTLDLALPLLRELDGLVRPAELSGLVDDLRPAVRTLTRTQPRLVQLLDLVTPVTDCVTDNALPILNAKLDDDALSTGQPVWAELLHGMVGLASASQDFDGNGPAVRYHGGYGDQLVSTGQVPQVGQLFGLADEPLIGSRPPWPGPGKQPPFRPDVPCKGQAVANLAAGMTPAPAARKGTPRRLTPAQLQKIEKRLAR